MHDSILSLNMIIMSQRINWCHPWRYLLLWKCYQLAIPSFRLHLMYTIPHHIPMVSPFSCLCCCAIAHRQPIGRFCSVQRIRFQFHFYSISKKNAWHLLGTIQPILFSKHSVQEDLQKIHVPSGVLKDQRIEWNERFSRMQVSFPATLRLAPKVNVKYIQIEVNDRA